MHVFIHGSGVYERLKLGQRTRILEIGFGLGLNFLLSADHAEKCQTSLHYTGIEHSLISADVFAELGYQAWLSSSQLNQLLTQVLAQLEQADNNGSDRKDCVAKVQHSVHDIADFTQLQLLVADATQILEYREIGENRVYDAIYLDAFSPEFNPECWTQGFFEQLASLITPEGRLATYCVKGSVRRNLESAGFQVTKYPGPTGKREVLWASLKPLV